VSDLNECRITGLLTVELWYEKTTKVTRSREENLRISRDLVFLIGALCTHGNVTSSEEPLTRLHLDELPFGEILDPFGPPERKWSYPGGELQVAGRLYERGLGVHAPSRLEINLDGRAVAFEAWVGVDGGNRKPEPRDSDRKRKVIAPYFTASTISLV
jgi:hypothetical protein